MDTRNRWLVAYWAQSERPAGFRKFLIMGVDVLYLLWLAMIGTCSAVAVVYMFRDYVPVFLHGLFKYGKTETRTKTKTYLYHLLNVPNSWFTHFYAVGVIWASVFLYSIFNFCYQERTISSWLVPLASLINPINSIECTSVLIGQVMLFIQVSRRLYECLCVSIFTGHMNWLHYGVGIVFYLLVGVSISAPFLSSMKAEWCLSCQNIASNIHWHHCAGVAVFLLASLHQHRCHVILAKLRNPSSKDAKVYKIPQGDWFEYVSSPHYFAEILIYVSFFIVQRAANRYLWLALVFVAQILSLMSTVTHTWYLQKFKEYPTKRFRIIPFVF